MLPSLQRVCKIRQVWLCTALSHLFATADNLMDFPGLKAPFKIPWASLWERKRSQWRGREPAFLLAYLSKYKSQKFFIRKERYFFFLHVTRLKGWCHSGYVSSVSNLTEDRGAQDQAWPWLPWGDIHTHDVLWGGGVVWEKPGVHPSSAWHFIVSLREEVYLFHISCEKSDKWIIESSSGVRTTRLTREVLLVIWLHD